MRRREFITLLGGAAAWPVAARAQGSQPLRRVSLLLVLDEKDPEANRRVKAFRLGMRDLGGSKGVTFRSNIGLSGAIWSRSR
jgi:putative tryptophan/tyrosine transport system substrate-binding protein